jgi:hypothetical protein
MAELGSMCENSLNMAGTIEPLFPVVLAMAARKLFQLMGMMALTEVAGAGAGATGLLR